VENNNNSQAYSCSFDQEIPQYLRKLLVHYRVQKSRNWFLSSASVEQLTSLGGVFRISLDFIFPNLYKFNTPKYNLAPPPLPTNQMLVDHKLNIERTLSFITSESL
jgi:hypothetical protein